MGLAGMSIVAAFPGESFLAYSDSEKNIHSLLLLFFRISIMELALGMQILTLFRTFGI